MTPAGSTGTPDEPPRDHVEEPIEAPPPGPPGGRIFSLEGRRAPGLYLVSWVLSIGGLGILLVGAMSTVDPAGPLLATAGILSVTVGLAAGAGSQIVERRDRHPDRYRGPSPLLVFFAYFFGLAAVGLVIIRTGLFDTEAPFGFFVTSTIQALGYAFVVWLFVVRSGALTWAQMGWPTWLGRGLQPSLRSIGVAIAVMLPTTFAILIAGGIVGTLLDVQAPGVLPTPGTSAEALVVALAAVLIFPIGEELFYRGFALTAWLRDLDPRTALIRSSVFFALVHIVNIRTEDFVTGLGQVGLIVVTLLPLSFVLGWLFIRHGMAAAIAGHVSYNAILLFLAFLGSSLPEPA